MKTNVNQWNFSDAFINCGRESNFSYQGRIALFDYLEQLEEDMEE